MFDEYNNYKLRELYSCSCTTPPLNYKKFNSCEIGVDNSFNAYGEVSIEKCNDCKRLWLQYFVEMEWQTSSGRWFRGIISENEAKLITPESALTFLERSDLIIYGGGFFDGIVRFTNGSILTNHFGYRNKI